MEREPHTPIRHTGDTQPDLADCQPGDRWRRWKVQGHVDGSRSWMLDHRPPYWSLIPCTDYVDPQGRFTAMCELLEGYPDDQHSHWLNPTGVEVTTVHRSGEREAPRVVVRIR